MKKYLSLIAVLLMAAALFAGCGRKNEGSAGGSDVKPAGDLSTGLYIATWLDGSDAGADEGYASVTSTAVAVTLYDDGTICRCVIDEISGGASYDAFGAFTSDLGTAPVSKNELGTGYGLAEHSGIGREWNEQAAAFAAYCEGKTVDELAGIALDDTGKPTDSELSSSVTISVTNYVDYVRYAAANARKLGASADDKLKLAFSGSLANSNAVAGSGGSLTADYNVCALTLSGSGVITSCVLDAVSGSVAFDAGGKVTTDRSVGVRSKNDLKEEYGMKKASSIGKEWYEQAAAFSAYVTGKTPAEVAGISLTTGGVPSDITSSVTISAGDFMAVIEKASK